MRTALLAAIKRTEEGQLRGMLQLAGRSVLGWQIDLALFLGCERILCLLDEPEAGLYSLQSETESLGKEFQIVSGIAQLLTLLRSDDELLVMQDGLLMDQEFAATLIDGKKPLSKAIYWFEPTTNLAASSPLDFERIDASRCWAGLIATDARSVEKLAEFSPDCDVLSALLRVALQSRVPCIGLRHAGLGDGDIVLATDVQTLSERHQALTERHAKDLAWSGPLRALALMLGRQMELKLERFGTAAVATCLFATTFLSAGAILAFLGFGFAGLSAAAVGSFASLTAVSSIRLRHSIGSRATTQRSVAAFASLVELAVSCVVILVLSPTLDRAEIIVLPLFVFGLVVLASRSGTPAARAFWSDRPSHLVILAVSSLFAALPLALATLGLAALAYTLLRSRAD